MPSIIPAALAAIPADSHLRAQVAAAVERQKFRVVDHASRFVGRTATIAALDGAIARGVPVVAVEGAPGTGVTALLCYLAAARPWPVWLPDEDAGQGLAALCAQLIALARLPVALLPTTAGRHVQVLERILAEAVPQLLGKLVLVIGPRPVSLIAGQPLDAPVPIVLPPGVTLVYGLRPGEQLPYEAERIVLPTHGPDVDADLQAALVQQGVDAVHIPQISTQACGSFLYADLVAGLLATGFLATPATGGLAGLLATWWSHLGPAERRVALILAVAGEAIPTELVAEQAHMQPGDLLARTGDWGHMVEQRQDGMRLVHPLVRSWIAARAPDEARALHTDLARMVFEHPDAAAQDPKTGYLMRHGSRHAYWGGAPARAWLTRTTSRTWIRMQERRSGRLHQAEEDVAWELRAAAASGEHERLVRAAVTLGILATRARTLPPEAPADVFLATAGHVRETALKRVIAILDELPDGRDKAQILRRLGEACYSIRMRARAMRLLSHALDLEDQGHPRAWRDEREQALVALARAALADGALITALDICALIGHAERRGLAETEAVRWLLARGERHRAERVAETIWHEAARSWAQAEVAVAYTRAGEHEDSDRLLASIAIETALAWARTELACDVVLHSREAARAQAAHMPTPALRDRALAQVALVLAQAGDQVNAYQVAAGLEDAAARVRALLDVALVLGAAAGETALAQAVAQTCDIGGDERTPLLAQLALTQATLGDHTAGLATAMLLPEGEEHDRVRSRVAVGMGRSGDIAGGVALARTIHDDDERDWALDDLARALVLDGRYQEAWELASALTDASLRARAQAAICTHEARDGDSAGAIHRLAAIERAPDRVRATQAVIAALVGAGQEALAVALAGSVGDVDGHSRCLATLAIALAEQGLIAAARAHAAACARAMDQVHAMLVIAREAPDDGLAGELLAHALQLAAPLGRSELLRALEWAAPVLAKLGGAALVGLAARSLHEVESWW